MIRAFRELRAYRAALTDLADCNFIQAQAATKGTRGEKLVVGVIVRMVNLIDSRTEVEERLDSVLNFYGLEEPTAEELRAAFEREYGVKRRTEVVRAATLESPSGPAGAAHTEEET